MMDNTTDAPPTLPLHIVADVLERLDNMGDLYSALHSSDVCRAAYDDYGPAILRSVMRNMIIPELVSYAVLMAESRQGKHMDLDAVKAFMTKYPAALQDSNYVNTTLRSFSMPTLQYLCETYNMITLISAQYLSHNYEIPWIIEPIDTLRIYCDGGSERCDPQRFKVHRALMRYEIFCNVCLPQEPGAMTRHVAETFLSAHPPLVNKEMKCLFEYLQIRVYRAFDGIAKLDILCFFSKVRYSINVSDINPNNRVHPNFLHRGLSFVYDVINGHLSRDQLKDLLPDSMIPQERDKAAFHSLWCSDCANMGLRDVMPVACLNLD